MATPISRDVLNLETDARFAAQTGFRPGYKLDPKKPTDKAMIPVWMDIFRKVQREAQAGTLVTTYDKPEVAQALSDAQLANTVAAAHVDAAAKATDPMTVQQNTSAAATAMQVASQKLGEAAARQPSTASPVLQHEAAREAAKTPPPPHASAEDQIAHAQIQNGQIRNGRSKEGVLRPEDDPWDPRYVPKTPPREQAPTPSRPAPPRPMPSRPALSREIIDEVNARFWNRTEYKRGEKLDMSIPEDREQAKIWRQLLEEVQREAREGRLTFTRPEPTPSPISPVQPPRPGAPQPMPPMPPMPPMQPTQPAMPPMPTPPVMPMPPPSMPMRPMPLPSRPSTPFQPMPAGWMRPGMIPPWMQPGAQIPAGAPGVPTPMRTPISPISTTPPAEPGPSPLPTPTPTPTPRPTEEEAPTEMPPEGMSTLAKVGLGALGIGVLALIAYAAKRESPRSRAAARSLADTFAFPPSRAGRP